jgi:hypothetical protein
LSSPRLRAVVLRTYQPTTDAAVRAVELLLRCNQGVKKAVEPAPESNGRNNVRKGQDAHTANQSIPK